MTDINPIITYRIRLLRNKLVCDIRKSAMNVAKTATTKAISFLFCGWTLIKVLVVRQKPTIKQIFAKPYYLLSQSYLLIIQLFSKFVINTPGYPPLTFNIRLYLPKYMKLSSNGIYLIFQPVFPLQFFFQPMKNGCR